jgi:Phosphodiester glycosidase
MASYWALVANRIHRWAPSRGSGNNVMPMIELMPSSSRRDAFLRTAKRGTKWLLAGILALGAVVGAGSVYKDRCELSAPTEIFEGITYGCRRLDTTEEGSGLVHWMSINLATPGIELYVTPLDPVAVAQGWQYRLRRVGDVVDKEKLAVAVNGTLFESDSGWRPRMAGDLAKSLETVVADHVVSHVWEHTYLLWFDEQLTPYLRRSKPPTAAELARAKWGIGGQAVWLWDGKIWPGSDRRPDSRTAIAVDRQRKLLFLAVGEHISPRLMLQELADLGAKDGTLLDGGSSSSMAIGQGAAGVSAGILYGGWRPVATHFGVKARPIRMGK